MSSATRFSSFMVTSFVGGAITGLMWREIFDMIPKLFRSESVGSEVSTSKKNEQSSQGQVITNGNFVMKTAANRKINMVIFGTAGENNKNTIKAMQGISVEDSENVADPLKMMYSPFIFRLLTEDEVKAFGKQRKMNYWRAELELKKVAEEQIRSDLPENLKAASVSVLTSKDMK